MNGGGTRCPACGSPLVVRRRQLFHALMEDLPLPAAFAWYSDRIPGACPPRSLLVISATLMMIIAVPVTGLWIREAFSPSALAGLLPALLLLVACLLYDLFMTWGRYRAWSAQWLCGHCRSAFSPVDDG